MATDDPSKDSPRRLLQPIVTVASNIAVLTALLVYFGWVRADTQSTAIGLPESVLRQSTFDYALRSVRPVFLVIVVVSLGAALWTLLDRALQVDSSGENGQADWKAGTARVVVRVLAWSPVIVLLTFAIPGLRELVPAALAAALSLSLYSVRLMDRGRPPDSQAARRRLVREIAVGTIATALIFTSITLYAQAEGRRLARLTASGDMDLPDVVVFSTFPLHLNGAGVTFTDLAAAADGGYCCRYTGLEVLEYSGDRFFLVPQSRLHGLGPIYLIPDDGDGIRVDLMGPRPPRT